MRETAFSSEPSSAGSSEPAAGTFPGGQAASAVTPIPAAVPVPPPPSGAAPSAQPAPPESPSTEYVLMAQVVETTWLKVSIDKGREVEYLLQPGEQLKWQAKTGFNLLVGNAAGLRLFLNGTPLKTLGQKGQVVSISLPDDSLLQPTAASSGPSSP